MEQEARSGGPRPAAPPPTKKKDPTTYRVINHIRIAAGSGVVVFTAGQVVSDPGYIHLLKEAKAALEPI